MNKQIGRHQKLNDKQNDWTDVELDILLGYHNAGVSASDLVSTFNRSYTSIAKKACAQGVTLRREK